MDDFPADNSGGFIKVNRRQTLNNIPPGDVIQKDNTIHPNSTLIEICISNLRNISVQIIKDLISESIHLQKFLT
jgi:hypothetical protein